MLGLRCGARSSTFQRKPRRRGLDEISIAVYRSAMSENRKQTRVVSMRVDAKELTRLEIVATNADQSVSSFMRHLVIPEVDRRFEGLAPSAGSGERSE